MVLCVKVLFRDAEKVKRFIISDSLIDPDYVSVKQNESLCFPITSKRGIKKEFPNVEFLDINCPKRTRARTTLRDAVMSDLSKEEQAFLRRAFDVTGSIAVLEIPDELKKKGKHIANTLLKIQKNINTVLKKSGIHTTEFRTQKMTWLAGKRTKETVHKEHGILLKLNVEDVYFSPRLSTERKRIASQVMPGESILVMFSGCAPYPCVLSRNTKAKDITGIELNPEGHKYAIENIMLNKLNNITLFNEDAKKAPKLLKKKFDRVIMPLPKSAGDFLDAALQVSKKGTTINFYAFEDKDKFDEARQRIKEVCKKNKKRCRILRTVRCGQQSPGTYRICVDFKLI